ncbi:MAG: hypothetical protein RAO94_11910 [Candidatus Stygibacter australis]|nr:hypothetical protein [Candidatus Stygibacter australis]MDP8323047.1 hypothetical protein [Candidatus Stygibacter australis]
MDFLDTIKKVSTGFERIEDHPLTKMTKEEQEKYIKGLALYTNIDLEITTEDINYLGMFIASANQSYEKISEYMEFAENPDEKEMEKIILWIRSSDYIDQFICDMLRKYRHQKPNQREEEMIGEISIMAGYSAIELAWLLTLIIEPDRRYIDNYLESCSPKLMKRLPAILKSLGYTNADHLIEKYFHSRKQLLDIFDDTHLDITIEVFDKDIRDDLNNHLFDSGSVQEVVKIEWKRPVFEKKTIRKGDELFSIRLVEAQSFLDMLIDPKNKSKAQTQRYTYTASNREKMSIMIFEEEMLSVHQKDLDERNFYSVGVLYDPREEPKKVLKWALDHDYITKEIAQKKYSELLN